LSIKVLLLEGIINEYILGTGIVGRTLAAKLSSDGYDVMIGTRNIDDTIAKTEPNAMGNPPYMEWQKENQKVKLGSFADAAKFGKRSFLQLLAMLQEMLWILPARKISIIN
jgi:hypothetical protein